MSPQSPDCDGGIFSLVKQSIILYVMKSHM